MGGMGEPSPARRFQWGFRTRRDIGAESDTSDGWLIDLNNFLWVYEEIDKILRVRFISRATSIDEDEVVNGHSMVYAHKPGGATGDPWGPFIGITSSGAVVRSVESGVGAYGPDQGDTTRLIGGGVPFESNNNQIHDSLSVNSPSWTWDASDGATQEVEVEWLFKFVLADVNPGDWVEIRSRYAGGAFFGGGYPQFMIIIIPDFVGPISATPVAVTGIADAPILAVGSSRRPVGVRGIAEAGVAVDGTAEVSAARRLRK